MKELGGACSKSCAPGLIRKKGMLLDQPGQPLDLTKLSVKKHPLSECMNLCYLAYRRFYLEIFHSLVFCKKKAKENQGKPQGIFTPSAERRETLEKEQKTLKTPRIFPWLEETKEMKSNKEWKIRV